MVDSYREKYSSPKGMCVFATIAHGGYGVWDVYQSMFRPVPSADDLMSTSPDDWEIRYQCHVARGPDYHPLTVIVGEQVGYKNVDQIYKYIDFDHTTPLTEIYPPVFRPPEGLRTNIDLSTPLSYTQQTGMSAPRDDSVPPRYEDAPSTSRLRDEDERGDH